MVSSPCLRDDLCMHARKCREGIVRQKQGPYYEVYTANGISGGLRDGSSSFMNRLPTFVNIVTRLNKESTYRNICIFTSDLNTTNKCVLSCVSTSAQLSHRSFGQYAQWNHSPEMCDMHRSHTANACVRLRR